MRPVSRETFTTLFQGLDTQAKREFVADLYSARGWEAHIDENTISVRRGDETRQLAVLKPPRLGTVTLPAVDEVVVTREHAQVRTAAQEAAVEYRTPGDLHDLLLYGLDRKDATTLLTEYFDQPLLVDESDAETPGITSALTPLLGWNTRRAGVVALLLLAIAVLAVSGGLLPGLDSGDTTPELNRTYTPGEAGAIGGDQQYPPGLGPEGVENSGHLTLAHYEYLRNTGYAYEISANGPQHAPFMLGNSRWFARVKIQDNTHYWYHKRSVAPYGFRVEQREDNRTVWVPKRPADIDNSSEPELLHKRVYANGTEKFWKYDGPNQVRYRRASIEQQNERTFFIADRIIWIDLYIQQFLWTENSSIRCLSETETRNCETYRVEATGDPIELRGDQTDYRAVAIVDQPGFVRELTVTYELPSLENQSQLEPFRFHLEYLGVGEEASEIAPPNWLEEARNRTGSTDGEQTETARTTTATETETESP